MNRGALLLVAAGVIAFIAAFFPLHRNSASVAEDLHVTNRLHERITGATVRDVKLADHLSTKDVQRDSGLVVRVVQLALLLVFAPGILFVLFATTIRGDLAIPTGVAVCVVGGAMVLYIRPYSHLSAAGIAWVTAATIAIAVGVSAFVSGLRADAGQLPR